MKLIKTKKRNSVIFDKWSIAHLGSGILLGWIINPFLAVVLLILWEPFEILILSPVLARKGITFGFETIRNSLSDICFDTLGVLIGYLALPLLVNIAVRLF